MTSLQLELLPTLSRLMRKSRQGAKRGTAIHCVEVFAVYGEGGARPATVVFSEARMRSFWTLKAPTKACEATLTLSQMNYRLPSSLELLDRLVIFQTKGIAAEARCQGVGEMGRSRIKLLHPSTALYCVGLVINNLLIQSGCSTFAPLAIDGHIHREIDATGPIQKILKNTPLAGATALDFDPRSGRLVLEYPNGTRKVEATIGSLGSDPRVASLVITWGTRWTQVEFDTERRLTSLRASSGLTFQLSNFRGRRPSASSVGIDPFFAANAELLEYVHQLDRDQTNGGTPLTPLSGTPSGGVQPPIEIKPTATAMENPLVSILAFLGSVLGVQVVLAGVPNLFNIFVWLFQATVAVEVIKGLLTGSNPPEATLAQGFLHIKNQLFGEMPVWAVFMIFADGTRSEDLLAGQAIPAGSSRDFALAPGHYDVALWVPATGDCFREYVHANVLVQSNHLTEIVVAAGDASQIVPEGCPGG